MIGLCGYVCKKIRRVAREWDIEMPGDRGRGGRRRGCSQSVRGAFPNIPVEGASDPREAFPESFRVQEVRGRCGAQWYALVGHLAKSGASALSLRGLI
jgi:hypothetical protein